MKKIFKYVIPTDDIGDVVKITMPVDHHITEIVKDPNPRSTDLWVYALVDPESEPCTENIYLVGTGHPADRIEGKAYLGIVILNLPGGYLVLHCFCDLEASYVDQFMGGV